MCAFNVTTEDFYYRFSENFINFNSLSIQYGLDRCHVDFTIKTLSWVLYFTQRYQ